jgi:hypothetical protein
VEGLWAEELGLGGPADGLQPGFPVALEGESVCFWVVGEAGS